MMDEATIQIPFLNFNIIIDVDLSIIGSDAQSLLSNRYTIINGLYIRIKGIYIYIGRLGQQQGLGNIFMYRWTAENISYGVYTEKEVLTIYRSF